MFPLRTLVSVAAAVGLLGGLVFGGGVAYGRHTAPQKLVVVQGQAGTNPSGQSTPGGAQARSGGQQVQIVSGTVVNLQGDSVTVSGQSGEVSVRLTADTVYRRTEQASRQDLAPGQQVLVQGQRDPSGAVLARVVQIGAETAPPR